LKIEIRPTMPAAATGVMFTICCAMGEAWLIIMIPAETFRNSSTSSSQNCLVRMACATVKLAVVADLATADVGCNRRQRDHPTVPELLARHLHFS
jgi:hypothetical protein